ncbi:MAG TPA: iron-sulfur cluster assembly accessory protein [Chitinophagaceae bacterium]|nr:iron-sulfur cluster assembly accessory protein [Chitinophagaceae bacterium]
METTFTTPVNFSDSAIKEVKRLMKEDDKSQSQYLRVGVKGGGCSGMTYVLDFDNIGNNDEVFVVDGISIIMNKAHGIYLMGMEVDFNDGLNARGFVFKNPNATSTCGCGTSFAV